MKLKYLLPVATIASVATIVTPLVSCGKGIPTSWDFKENKYTAKIGVCKGDEPITAQEATQIYYDKLSKEHGLFNDDLFVYLSDGFLSQEGMTINSAKAEAKISNLSLIEKEAPGETEKSKMIKATFNVTYDLDVSIKIHEETQSLVWSYTASIENFKMWIGWATFSDKQMFGFRPVISDAGVSERIAFLLDDDEWSLTSNGKIDGESVDFTNINSENLSEHMADIGLLTNIVSSISCSSHYLSEMELKSE